MDYPFLPHTEEDRKEMLREIGASSIEELFEDIPSQYRLKDILPLPDPLTEDDIIKEVKKIENKNISSNTHSIFLGGGIYDVYVPAMVKHIAQRPEFYTAYTPYQPEVSQGTLQVIYEHQTMISSLTGMDISNASMYDGATALAEAILLAMRKTKKYRYVISKGVNPLYIEVVKTYIQGIEEAELVLCDENINSIKNSVDENTAAFVIQNPDFIGRLHQLDGIADAVHEKGALFIVVPYYPSLALLEPPGSYGADIVCGEGQSLGLPMMGGGPLLGLFSAKKEFIRMMPGRIIGRTEDKDGKTAYVMTLQTREQHIKRERATSNICSNEGLCLLMSAVYLSMVGKEGLKEIAENSLQKAHYLYDELVKIDGINPFYDDPFFHEFALQLPIESKVFIEKMKDRGILAGIDLSRYNYDKNIILVSVTERRTVDEIDKYIKETRNILK